jgi:hypothetical protein
MLGELNMRMEKTSAHNRWQAHGKGLHGQNPIVHMPRMIQI